MQLQDLKTKRTKSKRVGRGGKRGKTSGRGHKGQKARAGRKMRPEARDIIKRIPKRRGYGKNRARTVNPSNIGYEVVNVADLENNFDKGGAVTPKELLSKKLVRKQNGRIPQVKILAKGDISKPLTITGCVFSDSAKAKIEKAGGSISR